METLRIRHMKNATNQENLLRRGLVARGKNFHIYFYLLKQQALLHVMKTLM